MSYVMPQWCIQNPFRFNKQFIFSIFITIKLISHYLDKQILICSLTLKSQSIWRTWGRIASPICGNTGIESRMWRSDTGYGVSIERSAVNLGVVFIKDVVVDGIPALFSTGQGDFSLRCNDWVCWRCWQSRSLGRCWTHRRGLKSYILSWSLSHGSRIRPFQIRNLFLISTFWKIQWGMSFFLGFLKTFFGCEKSIARSRLNQNKKYTHFGHFALSNTKKKKNRCGAFSRRAR